MTIQKIVLLVKDIQSLLASRNEPVEAELVDLASQHEEFVNAAARRLESVEQLLSKGLRSEAIERAEADPNLNDVLTALDFPELGPWNELLESKGIQPVPGISVEAAAELNDAYLASGSIEKLLQHYRTISLARAPLPKRIAALRKLAERDDQNPAWRLDLTEFEQHRIKEMRTELDAAVHSEDLTTVAQIDEELSGGGWSVGVPAALRQHVRKQHEGLRRKTAKAELETLSHQLSDAYAEFNRPLAKRLQQRFLAVQGIAGINNDHPLLDIAGPALDWLVEESRKESNDNEHRSAVAEIETALDRRTSVDELEKLYHRATRHGHSLPQLLETRLVERRDLLRANVRRTRVLITTVSVLASIGFVVAVTLMVQKMSFNKSVAQHNEELGKLIANAQDTGQLAPIDDYLKSVASNSPAMLQTPALLARTQELESLRQSESGRMSQVRVLKTAIQRVAEFGTQLHEFPVAYESLKQLQPLVKGENEKSDMLTLEQGIDDRHAHVQKMVDEAFGAELNGISDDVAALPQDSLTAYESVFARLTTLAARRDVSEPLKQSVLALQSKVQQDRQMVASNMKTAAGLQKITDSVGQLASYEQNMQQYVRDNPGTERAKSFVTLLNSEATIWKSVTTWNLLRRRLKLVEPNRISPVEAQQLVGDCEAYQRASGPFGDDLLKSEIFVALQAIAARAKAAESDASALIMAVLARKTISNAFLIQAEEGNYYSKDVPVNNSGSSFSFDFYTTTTGTQTTSKTLPGVRVTVPGSGTPDDWLSPQTKMYRRIGDLMKNPESSTWELLISTAVAEVANDTNVDPLLRLFLVEEMLKLGASGSEPFRKRSEKILTGITSVGASRLTNWAPPGDERAKDERILAKAFLESRTKELVQELSQITEDLVHLRKSALPPDLKWAGWMHRNTKSEWIVSLAHGFTAEQRHVSLSVFCVPAQAQATVTKIEIAKLVPAAKLSLSANPVPESPLEGRPVYLILD